MNEKTKKITAALSICILMTIAAISAIHDEAKADEDRQRSQNFMYQSIQIPHKQQVLTVKGNAEIPKAETPEPEPELEIKCL